MPDRIPKYVDVYDKTASDARYSLIAHAHSFASLTSTPTTLAGYGIVNAAPLTHTHLIADVTDFPTQTGQNGKYLTTNGTTLSWNPLLPAGSDTQVQFNDGGVFAGNANLIFNKTTNTLSTTNVTITGTFSLANNLSVKGETTTPGTFRNLIKLDAFNRVQIDLDGASTLLGGNVFIDGKTFLPASTTTNSPFNIPQGVAPTAPVDGDFWTKTDGAYVRINSVTNKFLTDQSIITTLGTITIGVWNGTAIASAYLGAHTHAADDITSGVLATARGGTGIAFFTAAGPTIARIYTFPDSAATILFSGMSGAALTSATLTTPNIGVATGTSLATTGLIKSSGTAGIGYATGAGGTVTQATNKTTTVTLSKVVGTIVMNAASLAAAAIASFTWTNTLVAVGDVILIDHVSVGTSGAYTINCFVSAGSVVVSVRNNTAGALAEGITIGFAVIKGVTA